MLVAKLAGFRESRAAHRWSSARQLRINQGCELIPYAGIVLDFVVRLVEGAGYPRIVVAIDGIVPVLHLKVSNYLRACWIGREDLRASVKDSA